MMAVESPPAVIKAQRCTTPRRKGPVVEPCNHLLLRVRLDRWEEVVRAHIEIKCPRCGTIHDSSKWV
jgi:hypothetical protein